MIDIHSHILPGVDDGAKVLDESLQMLSLAVEQGVKTQVLTPHIHLGRFNNQKQDLQARFSQFKNQVDEAKINIELKLAAEVRIGPEVMQMASKDEIPCLGTPKGKRTFLLEFPRQDIPYGSDNVVRWLLTKSYLPIIVHPERNRTFVNNSEKLQTYIDLGCPIQITASSLTGKFGEDVQQFAEKLLKENKVSAIASDCHNLKGRAPDLLQGVKHAANIIGEQAALALVNEKPKKLIEASS